MERTATEMAHYKVSWEIDIEDVDTPREAAQLARAIMLDPSSEAVTFSVAGELIDLGEE